MSTNVPTGTQPGASMPSPEQEARGQGRVTPGSFPGAPYEPVGNPMLEGVGPAAFAQRSDHPDLTVHGEPKIVPISTDPNYFIEPRDPDPRGMQVVGADGRVAGTVVDLWVDRAEPQLRYLTVELPSQRRVLLPATYIKVDTRRGILKVKSIRADQFETVPGIKRPDRVTLLEEDMIMAYYAGGYLYADRSRMEPLI